MGNNYEMNDHKSEKKSKSGLVSALVILLIILLVMTCIFYLRGKSAGNNDGDGFFAELFGQKVNIDGSTSDSNGGKGENNVKTDTPALTLEADNSSKAADTATDKDKVDIVDNDPAENSSDDSVDNNGEDKEGSSEQNSNGDHQHVFDNWVTIKEATCGDPGEEQATCSCGETTTRTIPPTGDHAWGDWEVVESYQDLAPAFGGAENHGDVGGPAPGDQVIDQQGRIRRRTCRKCNQVQEEVNN